MPARRPCSRTPRCCCRATRNRAHPNASSGRSPVGVRASARGVPRLRSVVCGAVPAPHEAPGDSGKVAGPSRSGRDAGRERDAPATLGGRGVAARLSTGLRPCASAPPASSPATGTNPDARRAEARTPTRGRRANALVCAVQLVRSSPAASGAQLLRSCGVAGGQSLRTSHPVPGHGVSRASRYCRRVSATGENRVSATSPGPCRRAVRRHWHGHCSGRLGFEVQT